MLPVLATITDHLASFSDVKRVVLYGSRARGDNLPRADIDLAVESVEGASLSDVWAYLTYDAPTLLHIDLTHLNTAPDALRRNIERDGVTLYER